MSYKVLALCTGTAQPFRGEQRSAIANHVTPGRLEITALGLAGDEQADQTNHGGPDMALHHYPLDHHAFWREHLGPLPLLDDAGAFSTNLSTLGLTEAQVLLGDRFRLGSALLEVCQPRKPCWKIEHMFGETGMVAKVLESGRCGWFYRVIEPGHAQAGDMLEQVESGLLNWSMARIFEGIWGTAKLNKTGKRDPALLREISDLAGLPERLRTKIDAILTAAR